MPSTNCELEQYLEVMSKAGSLMQDGASLEEASIATGYPIDFLSNFANRSSVTLNAFEALEDSPFRDAVVPMFATASDDAALEHVGSGVLLEIDSELFLLTAAHVVDHKGQEGDLWMPSREGIQPLFGQLWYTPAPTDGRATDKADIACYHLPAEWREKLSEEALPLGPEELLLTDQTLPGELFSFHGFPCREVIREGDAFAGSRNSYTGHAVTPDAYERLGYSPVVHIVSRFRRRKAFGSRYGRRAAGHPEGISGGAVIVWPRTIRLRMQTPELKLAGICHTYHAKDHCMAATRIIPYLMIILKNLPELGKHFESVELASPEFLEFLEEIGYPAKNGHPLGMVGVAWYTKVSYEKCLAIFDDRSDLPNTYEEWFELALDAETDLDSQGLLAMRVHIDPATFPEWCAANGFSRIDEQARGAFAASSF